jgi:V8-like Glu-specific endopeptidase
MDPKHYLVELGSALEEYRFRDVRTLTDQIDPSAFELPQIKKALSLIRRKCLFAELEHAASLFNLAGKDEPVIRRQWCQSLLDQGRVSQALTALNSMSEKFSEDPVEGPEIRGLIGRAYKQRFVSEDDAENLRAAISAYSLDWELRRGDYRWHGINLVALLLWAKRDGISAGSALDPARIAQQILDDIDQHGATGVWDYATAMEAAVALKDDDAVLASAKKYIQHPDADAFELASTLRQLKEIWRLEGTALGNKLLPVLECAVLQRKGGSVQPVQLAKVPDRAGFEAVWGAESFVYLQWIDTLYRCCSSIARIMDAATGEAKGTGFLLSGTALCPTWGDAPVFLTNSHVISSDPADGVPLRPSDAVAEFTRLDGRPKVKLGELLYNSPRFEMDVSVLRIVTPSGSNKLELCYSSPKISNEQNEQRIYVIGHPGGRELAVSLYDNKLAEYSQQYVRYRSPTEAGNSGSPVFDRQLKCLAIHHRALENRQLNEGIMLNAISGAIAGL